MNTEDLAAILRTTANNIEQVRIFLSALAEAGLEQVEGQLLTWDDWEGTVHFDSDLGNARSLSLRASAGRLRVLVGRQPEKHIMGERWPTEFEADLPFRTQRVLEERAASVAAWHQAVQEVLRASRLPRPEYSQKFTEEWRNP